MAIAETKLSRAQVMDPARSVQDAGGQGYVLHLGVKGAGVHAQGATERAGDAGKKVQPGEAGVAGGHGDVDIQGRCPGGDFRSVHGNAGQPAAQAHHHAGNAAVPDQGIGTDADDGERNIGRLFRHELDQVFLVGGTEHDFRRAADLEPGYPVQGRVFRVPAAHGGQPFQQGGTTHFRRHHHPASASPKRRLFN